MVSIFHKDLEYKVEKLKYKKLEVMQSRIEDQKQTRTCSCWMNHPRSVNTKFHSRDWIDTVYHFLVKNSKGRGGGLINLLPLKRRGLFERKNLKGQFHGSAHAH